MLQQILRDMYVDPEILAELPEEQKEMLFFKIRQEQIRRYNERENQNERKKSNKKVVSKKGKKVCILEDANGNPWTWIYGEGEVTAEEKWRRMHEKRMNSMIKTAIEEVHFAREQTSKNGRKSSRQHGEMVIIKKSSRSPSSSPNGSPPNTSPITQLKSSPSHSPVMKRKEANGTQSKTNQNGKPRVPSPPLSGAHHDVVVVKATSIQKIEVEKPKLASKPTQKPSFAQNSNAKIAEQLKRGENSKKVSGFQRKETAVKKSTQQMSDPVPINTSRQDNKENIYENFHLEPLRHDESVSNEEWQTQLQRFKEADRQRSIRARRASREYKRQSLLASNPEKLRVRFKHLPPANPESETKKPPTLPPKPIFLRKKHPVSQPGKQSKPQNREEVKEWFENTQAYNISSTHSFPPWLHGLLSRAAAEELLKNKKQGDFLIRVSDKVWGYALSYKDMDRIKHFLIDASEEGCYHFFGNDQIRHESLEQLILYHQEETISYNGEKLKNFVGQKDPRNPDYSEFESTDTRL